MFIWEAKKNRLIMGHETVSIIICNPCLLEQQIVYLVAKHLLGFFRCLGYA